MRDFLLHFKRRHHTGKHTALVRARGLDDAKNALIEFERGRGFKLTRFLDEPTTYDRSETD